MMEGHPIQEHNTRFDRIERSVSDILEKLFKGGERIKGVEESTKSAHHRLDDREEEIKAIREVAFSVRTLAEEMKGIKTDLKDFHTRVTHLERKPGDTAIKFWHVFVVSLITGISGMVLTYTAMAMQLKP
jgi:chromosome segregation ATPase